MMRAIIVLLALVTPAQAELISGPEQLTEADIFLLGELHDNPDHHVFQASAVASTAPRAIVFEMLSAEQAALITPDTLKDPDALAEALKWDQSGWPDFNNYHQIMTSAPAQIIGAALPSETVRAAIVEDVADLFGAEADRFGLAQPLDAHQQTQREALQARVHCDAMPAAMFAGMVNAQRLRDAHFARVTLKALSDFGGPVVVIAGNGHVRLDWGMPVYLRNAAPDVTVLSLGQLEDLGSPKPYDFWTIAPAPDRGDPCDAFR